MPTLTKNPKAAPKPALPDAVAFLDATFGGTPDWDAAVERARLNADVAQAIYDLRTSHNLTQRELAELVGTKQPVIARLEDADYEGHSLSMLNRIAGAVRQRVEVNFVPVAETADTGYAARRETTTRVRSVSNDAPPLAVAASARDVSVEPTKRGAGRNRSVADEPSAHRRKLGTHRSAAAGARPSKTSAAPKSGSRETKSSRSTTHVRRSKAR